MLKLFLALLILAGSYYYALYIDEPERWVSAAPVVLSDEGITITLTNLTDQPVTVSKLGIAWEVQLLQFRMIQFPEVPREIPPHETFTEKHPIEDLGSYVEDITSAKKHRITLDLHINGKRKGGFTEFSRLRATLETP